jgi:hypothetical protein
MIYSRHRRKMADGGDVTTTEGILKGVADQYSGTMPSGSTITATNLADSKVTGTDVTGPTALKADEVEVTPVAAATPTAVTAPTTPAAGTYDYTATTVAGKEPTATAAELSKAEIAPEVTITAPQGTLSPEAKAIAAQGQVEQEQLVSYQLGELMDSIQTGKPLPAWAAGPARAATQVMQQRGLGSSSMAAAAMSQALVEAGIPIAAADAAEYSKLNITNLNNRQQAVLQNAAAAAQMDMANLDARMKAAVTNAQSFLAIDLQNLSNEQATEVLNYQGKLQALFTDAAADNAAKQFNAKTQQQVDEFFSELGVQVDNANANRVAAMEQFNVDQKNSVMMFNSSMEDARQRFNANMAMEIEQSNAAWRRQIATIDTATANEVNRQNAMNILQVNQNALSALWQRYRDESAWLMQSTENERQRAHQLAMLEYEKTGNIEMFEMESEYETAASVGSAALALVLGFIG